MDINEKITINISVLSFVQAKLNEPKPTWQQSWIYWYLRFSKSYWDYTQRIKSGKTNLKVKGSKKYQLKYLQDQLAIGKTYDCFGNVFDYDFTTWWHLRGKHQFSPQMPITRGPATLFEVTPFKTISDEYIAERVNLIEGYLKLNQTLQYTPHVIASIIPIKETKRKTIKEFERYLDQIIDFGPKDMTKGFFTFQKNKIRLSTVYNALKVYLIRLKYNNPDLANIAIEADVLEGAMADYRSSGNDIKKMNSLDSLRSGTSRQIKQALLLAENAARGKFPSTELNEFHNLDIEQSKFLLQENEKITEIVGFDQNVILNVVMNMQNTPPDLSINYPSKL